MCSFCERFDFGSASYEIDKYGVRLVLAISAYKFPLQAQFFYCPRCGAQNKAAIHEAVTITEETME